LQEGGVPISQIAHSTEKGTEDTNHLPFLSRGNSKKKLGAFLRDRFITIFQNQEAGDGGEVGGKEKGSTGGEPIQKGSASAPDLP